MIKSFMVATLLLAPIIATAAPPFSVEVEYPDQEIKKYTVKESDNTDITIEKSGWVCRVDPLTVKENENKTKIYIHGLTCGKANVPFTIVTVCTEVQEGFSSVFLYKDKISKELRYRVTLKCNM